MLNRLLSSKNLATVLALLLPFFLVHSASAEDLATEKAL